MRSVVIRVLLVASLAFLAAFLVRRQQRIGEALQAENALLGAQTNAMGDFTSVREENQRLRELSAVASELARLRADQTDLESLHSEAGLLRSQLAELTALQRARALATELAQSNIVGTTLARVVEQTLPKEDWKNAGQASPPAALETYLWAVTRGDLETLRQCAHIRVPPGYTNDLLLLEMQYRQDDWEGVRAVQVLSAWQSEATTADLQVEFILPRSFKSGRRWSFSSAGDQRLDLILPPRSETAGPEAGGEPELRDKKRFHFVRSGDGWKLDLPPPPQTSVVFLSPDPEERTRQIAALPAQLQEMLKSAPAGRKLVMHRFGLPSP